MKISAFPKCWIEDISEGRMSLFEWIETSTQLECEGLEMYPDFLKELTPEYLSGIRQAIESRGMKVSMMCHSPDFTVPKDELPAQIEKQCRMIRATAELGGGFCRILSGQRRPDLDTEETIKQVVNCIEKCLPEAEKNHVVLSMENHFKDGYWKYPEFAQKQDIFLKIIDQIDSPFFGVQYDPSNAIVAGEDPLNLLDKVLYRIKTMHASDRYLQSGFKLDDVMLSIAQTGYPKNLLHGVVGKGLNNFPVIFEKLSSIGYDGWVSIEDGINGMEEMKESVDFLKKMREEYFSGQ
jgi:sugar phosphate isomerase/epimerase